MILAGPNGSGKSTMADRLLRDVLGIRHFVNADTIARGLSAYASEEMAVKAGRIMLEHLHDLAKARATFALETTLATRTFAPWVQGLKADGYQFGLAFLWVPSADINVERVAKRVQLGGHHVPEETIRRRYERGLRNFFQLFLPLADFWQFYDNEFPDRPRILAEGHGTITEVKEPTTWQMIQNKWAK